MEEETKSESEEEQKVETPEVAAPAEVEAADTEPSAEVAAAPEAVAEEVVVVAPEAVAEEVVEPVIEEPVEEEVAPVPSEEPVPTPEKSSPAEPQSQAVLEPQLVAAVAAPASVASQTSEPEAVVAKASESEESEEKDEDDDSLPKLSPEQDNLPWYVVHTYSGYEMRVKLGIEERIRAENVQDKFGHIIVPEEKVVELVRGEKKTTKRKIFPGYILVQCELDDETWHLVKATPKVTGFIGDSHKPVPLAKEEIEALIAQMEGGGQRARPSVEYEQGDSIKVVNGPFAEFNGTVDEVKPEKGKLRVLISIFGRNTPVELDFVQVEKV